MDEIKKAENDIQAVMDKLFDESLRSSLIDSVEVSAEALTLQIDTPNRCYVGDNPEMTTVYDMKTGSDWIFTDIPRFRIENVVDIEKVNSVDERELIFQNKSIEDILGGKTLKEYIDGITKRIREAFIWMKNQWSVYEMKNELSVLEGPYYRYRLYILQRPKVLVTKEEFRFDLYISHRLAPVIHAVTVDY